MPERRAWSVSVFARHAGRVLLIRHRRLGTWLPVGGEVEEGETPLEAAARELPELQRAARRIAEARRAAQAELDIAVHSEDLQGLPESQVSEMELTVSLDDVQFGGDSATTSTS